ncbi:glycogen/starch/alpha-glucan phosphorylase [Gephyromycinifex aptenodytis]|uniref:glycogen/starch/alpha-glucan phosphorylase n=1 Tax=Gephyromycinifex aptenodytis TaxID=2716227 RepID=UPI001D021CED|nr:glycogen/starch/alpha-glucan phosphorylase [Gephyromycinifex aptenodytis]
MGPTGAVTHPVALRGLVRPERSVDGFVREFLQELNYGEGITLDRSSVNDQYLALARTVRNYLMADRLETAKSRRANPTKIVGYLSAEFLLGRQLGNALLAADLENIAAEGLQACGLDLAQLRAQEVEPGLGNGGLGRLAACFIDSLATMDVACIGYGIRYEYGIFKQTFEKGRQVEVPDAWLSLGSPWDVLQHDHMVKVNFGGHTERSQDENGQEHTEWVPAWNVLGVPHDYMVPGYRNGVANTLRLWSARATNAFDLQIFNSGDYAQAVRAQTFAENITKVLYPEDSTPQGRELRLQQQYFFVACSLKDFIDRTLGGADVSTLPERVIWQLNDTHPVIAIPELMRLLMDERGLSWEQAWDITSQCFAYTCHTLLPEALEEWPVDLLGRLLPRHLEIIYRINTHFLEQVREAYPGDHDRLRRMSIIGEGAVKTIRMAHLATVVGTKVNGVAELHSQLLRDKVLVDFAQMWPEKFTNVTNGITPRRFIRHANPSLSSAITEAIGDGWVTDLERLRELEPLAEDASFREIFRGVKAANKTRLRNLLVLRDGIELADDHLVDAMVKRLHEYKRQTLKLLHVVSLYEGLTTGRLAPEQVTPRTVVFGAKAAPGYFMAKEIIALINAVSATIRSEPKVADRLSIIFPANYNVTLAEKLIPAADLSEQISLAGKEASGTGNMKFMLNGALTVGTDDGANVEIRKLVGDEHFFLFGMDEPQVAERQAMGYDPHAVYEQDERLKAAIDLIASGAFTGGDADAARPVVDDLLWNDRFMALADFASYLEVQERIETAYADPDAWSRSAIINIARGGFFSSDRSMRDYIERIWGPETLR